MGGKRISVTAARHGYRNVPISLPLDLLKKANVTALRDDATSRRVPVQIMEDSSRRLLCWTLDDLPKGQTRRYTVLSDEAASDAGVTLVEAGAESIEFRIGGSLFTSYHHGGNIARPFLYPVIGPGGQGVTRSYPMVKRVAGETDDHEHHRSIWVAHGDVNGVDDWSEERGRGRIVQREFLEKSSGPVFGRVRTLNDWVSSSVKKIMEEERTVTVYNLPDTRRLLDLSVVFRATEGDVRFGDTKEGGIIAVRVATSMDGDKGGTITNSFGAVTEAEAWGRRAHWCDYSGPVAGRIVGIAIFDNPGNLRHPAYWHVRDYGLMTANPFALSAYTGDPKRDGSYVLKSGESLRFSFRVYIHDGDVRMGDVAEGYHGYVNPPVIKIQ